MENWVELSGKLERLLRLRTSPLSCHFIKNKESLQEIPGIKYPKHDVLFCQIIGMSRLYEWTMACTVKHLLLPNCGSVMGLSEPPEALINGEMSAGVWFNALEDAKLYVANTTKMPQGLHEAIVIAPLKNSTLEPDVVVIYGNPAQMMLTINGLQWKDYKKMKFECVGESSCSDAIPRCYLTREPSLTIPCFGERRFAGVMDEELVMALPPSVVNKLVEGLEALMKRGICYPIRLHGITQSARGGIPKQYIPISEEFKQKYNE